MYKTYIEIKHENRDRLGPSEIGQAGYLLTRLSYQSFLSGNFQFFVGKIFNIFE